MSFQKLNTSINLSRQTLIIQLFRFWQLLRGFCISRIIAKHYICILYSKFYKKSRQTVNDNLPLHKNFFTFLPTLCTFYKSRTHTRCTYIHFLCSAVCLNFYRLYVRTPLLVCSSMRMAHSDTKVSAFSTNCTFCHDYTSLFIGHFVTTLDIVSKCGNKCKNFSLNLKMQNERQLILHLSYCFTRFSICPTIFPSAIS